MNARILMLAALCALPLAGSVATARAQMGNDSAIRPEIAAGTVPDTIPGVGVDENFDRPVPMDAVLTDHTGRRVRLGEYFQNDRPVVLTLVYHQCASFCDMVLRAVADTLQQQPWTIGTEFDVITLSVDPRDIENGARTLADARSRLVGRYGRQEAEQGWHFLGGEESEVRRIAEAVGFQYQWDERTQQYAHPGVIMVLQPSGRVARYLYGLEFPSNDVRVGLLEAAEGRHVTTVEQLILYCYRWDHADGRYVIAAKRVMRAAGVATVLILGAILFVYWRRERRRDAAAERAEAAASREAAVRETLSSAGATSPRASES